MLCDSGRCVPSLNYLPTWKTHNRCSFLWFLPPRLTSWLGYSETPRPSCLTLFTTLRTAAGCRDAQGEEIHEHLLRTSPFQLAPSALQLHSITRLAA